MYFLLCRAVYLLLKLPNEHFSGSKFLAVALVALSAFGCLRTSFESSPGAGTRVLVSYDVYQGTAKPAVLIRDELMQDLLPDEVWKVLTPSLVWLGPHDRWKYRKKVWLQMEAFQRRKREQVRANSPSPGPRQAAKSSGEAENSRARWQGPRICGRGSDKVIRRPKRKSWLQTSGARRMDKSIIVLLLRQPRDKFCIEIPLNLRFQATPESQHVLGIK